MAIFNIFSKRQKELKGEIPNIYVFDNIPQKLKIQINHILDDAIGIDNYSDRMESKAYELIHKTLCREYGVFHLVSHDMYPKENVLNFFLNEKDVEKNLDVIELGFRFIDLVVRKNIHSYPNKKIEADEAIFELNERFRENGVGYSFEGGEIIKVESTYIHNEITKPTIALTWNTKFSGANDEYMKAHKHYRAGNNKECLNECLKALESTLKIICKNKGWNFAESDTSRRLIQICFSNELVPTFTQNQFTSLQNLIESGVPSIRNKKGGHGQGENIVIVDESLARYALNLTGTNIIFLINQSKI